MDVLVVTVVHDPEDARIRHRQIAALREAGHHVTLAAAFTEYGRPIPDDIDSIDIPRSQGSRRLAAMRAVRQLLRRRGRDFDVVLLHDPELVVASAGLAVPGLVWDVHEDTAAAIRMKPWLPRGTRLIASRMVRAIERSAERRMPLILAEEAYAGRFRRTHPIVRNSVVASSVRAHGVAGHVVYLGRLTRPRGALDLIELGRKLAPDIEVHVIGHADHDCLAQVRAAHEEGTIRWYGFMPNNEALALLPDALAGLSLLHEQPNYAHSRPTKIIEYMAHGLPVITTPNPASSDLVERHDCGIVVPFGDIAAAEKAVRDLHADRALRDRMGEAGHAAVVEHYSWEADADLFVRTLEKLSEQSSR